MFIRYWATTDTSVASMLALDFCQAILRFAPVRLISLTGQLEGRWAVMSRLLETNMITPMVNVVCAEQEHWSRTIKVGMPESDTMRATLASGKDVETKVETVEHERELYTIGVRNVLIAPRTPTLERYALAAAKYEAIVVPTQSAQANFATVQLRCGMPVCVPLRCGMPVCVPLPMDGEARRTLRSTVLGAAS